MAETHSTPARVRPGSVTISSYLLILVAVIQVINLILTFATLGATRQVLEDAYRDSSIEGMDAVADLATAFAVGASLITLLLAVGLVVLALLNNRGKNGSRITTWVLGGILFCCTGGGLASGAAGSITGPVGGSSADMPSQEEIARRLEEALPSWYTPVNLLVNLIALLALLAALILLALPASNEFFRKRQPAWEPPVPGAYPGYPSGAPGYPPQGQAGYHPQGQQPGYPAPGQPGYPPASGYPGQPSSGEPGYPSTPGHPGQPAGEPGYPPSADAGRSSAGDTGGSTGGSTGGEQSPPSDQPPKPSGS